MERGEGRIDHLAASPDGRRLFVATLGSDLVEEIDTERRKVVGIIRGIKEPQGVYYIAKSKRLAVASGGDGNVRIYDQDSKLVGTVDSAGRRGQRTLPLSEQPSLCRIRTL